MLQFITINLHNFHPIIRTISAQRYRSLNIPHYSRLLHAHTHTHHTHTCTHTHSCTQQQPFQKTLSSKFGTLIAQ
uniref:Uncharacterized protein n=1 Tax=Octopus bimaculoides TaxID=37653 RepID=A0A0L8FI55_OCTBM